MILASMTPAFQVLVSSVGIDGILHLRLEMYMKTRFDHQHLKKRQKPIHINIRTCHLYISLNFTHITHTELNFQRCFLSKKNLEH